MSAEKVQGFILYRIFYGETLVYVGRTKRPLQDRIRGHLFAKPMHRKIAIEQVTKIEYVEFKTEADMNLYEIYFILKWHPPLNIDDKTRDYPTVELPDVQWTEFRPPLWEKWHRQIADTVAEHEKLLIRYRELPEEFRLLRDARRMGEIDDDTFYERNDALKDEQKRMVDALWK